MDRRTFIKMLSVAAAAPASLARAGGCVDNDFLDDVQSRGFLYFLEKADPRTGLVRETAPSDGSLDPPNIRHNASIAATGFGLAVLCIGAARGWIAQDEARKRVLLTLRSVTGAAGERGWCYHWLDLATGARSGAAGPGGISELSTVDYSFFLAGALAARGYFAGDAEVAGLVDPLYQRVDFPWMEAPRPGLLGHGWTPESGFLPAAWDQYSEASVLYLLAIGSPTHPLPPETWYAWQRTPSAYGTERYIGSAPLFTYQYSHAFVDFRGRRERRTGIDWFDNSRAATRAHRQFCMDLSREFPDYGPQLWGITPAEGPRGYAVWGGPPRSPLVDGSVVPCAAAGSLMFEPELCLATLGEMKRRFGSSIYGRYGFADAFNPLTGWVAPHVNALDIGITVLSAENLRSGNVWRWFMAAGEIKDAMAHTGLGTTG